MPGAPLRMVERPLPLPGPHRLRIAVAACGVCRGAVEGALVLINPLNLPRFATERPRP
jgi:hypothetical protein